MLNYIVQKKNVLKASTTEVLNVVEHQVWAQLAAGRIG